MKRREEYIHDAFDSYVGRFFKNWVLAFPLPVNGRVLLLEQITQKTKGPFLWLNLALAIIRWSFRKLILQPIDIAFQPVLYSSDIGLYPTYVIHKDSSTLHRLMMVKTISSGLMLINVIV